MPTRHRRSRAGEMPTAGRLRLELVEVTGAAICEEVRFITPSPMSGEPGYGLVV